MSEESEQFQTHSSESHKSSAYEDSDIADRKSQGIKHASSPVFRNTEIPTFPVLFPALIPQASSGTHDPSSSGAGVYAVHVSPFTTPGSSHPAVGLIPLRYNIPVRRSSAPDSSSEQGMQQQRHPAPERQVIVRRFQIVFQLDLLLMFKLAAVIFLFNQDGSKKRLFVLVLLASLVYLYQTGALSPLMRWLSQIIQSAAINRNPPPPINPPEGIIVNDGSDEQISSTEGASAENSDQGAANEQRRGEPASHWHQQWRRIMKEVQLVVVGFVASLLPGFHNID